MPSNDKFSWKEMSDVVHAIKEERVVICGAIQRLKASDNKLARVEDKLMLMIEKHGQL